MKAFLTLMLTLLFSAMFSQAGNWNQFRGGEKQGVCWVDSLPTVWNDSVNVLWQTQIPGYGHSSPVIDGNHIYVTTAVQELKFLKFQKWFSAILKLLLLVLLFLLFRDLYRQYKNLQGVALLSVFQFLAGIFALGLCVFFIFLGTYFYSPSRNDHITLTNIWHYGAMALSMLLIFIFNIRSLPSKKGVFYAVGIIIYLMLHMYFRPHPDYYPLFERNFMTPTLLSTGVVLLSTALLFLLKGVQVQLPVFEKWIFKKGIGFISIWVLIAFLAGIFGIQLYRFVIYNLPAGSLSFPGSDLLLRDGYIFYRLCLLTLGASLVLNLVKVPKISIDFDSKFIWLVLLLAGFTFLDKNLLSVKEHLSRKVLCIDKNTGRKLWEKSVHRGDATMIHLDNSFATPTPIAANGNVYSYFGSAGLFALNSSGKLIWENKDVPFYSVHGVGASPYFANNKICIVNDMADSAYMASIDANSGALVYKVERRPMGNTWSSYRTPFITTVDSLSIVFVWNDSELDLYNQQNGKKICSTAVPKSKVEMVAGVLVKGDTIFAADMHHAFCVSIEQMLLGKPALLWETSLKGKGPIDASMVLVADKLFMISDNGRATCLHAQSGEILWQEKLKGRFMSSVFATKNHVYLSNTKGQSYILNAADTFELHSINKLPKGIYATPASDGTHIFIRTTDRLYCMQ